MRRARNGISRRAAMKAMGTVAVAPFVGGCLGISGSSSQLAIESTFDEDKEGWSVVDMQTYGQHSDPNWGEIIQTLEFTHESTGGVDGSGHIRHVDDTGGKAFFFSASDAFLGEVSDFAGGRLEFSLKTSPNDWHQDSAVVLQSGDTVVATGFERPESEWKAYTIPLDADSQTYYKSNLSGPEIDQSTLQGVLSDLQALRINGEYSNETQEKVGLDEVRLATA
jgi:hypothetical protein